jgi:isopentenyl diphosphate isomerase/L-lactate dehydrogenase-like FMN-dependent dehydrogenase
MWPTGGLRNGLAVAKGLTLGADLASLALSVSGSPIRGGDRPIAGQPLWRKS